MAETNPNGAKRKCSKCLRLKTLRSFEVRSDTGKHRGSCKNCSSLRKKDWYNKNKLDYRVITAIRKYNITEVDYFTLIEKHGGLCAICWKKETAYESRTKQPKSLSIDHNHATGKVRGMLCWRCNAMLGYAKDNIEVLKNAIAYLKKHE